MNISQFSYPQADAKEKYRALLASDLATPLNRTRKRVYYALSKGNKVIDMYTAIEQAGLNGLKEPRIAVCRADAEICYFHYSQFYQNGWKATGGGIFSMRDSRWRIDRSPNVEPVRLPEKTYPELVGDSLRHGEMLKTAVPQVPQEYMPRGALSNYYVLWEVDKWTREPPRDPFLLRRLSKNLFEVLAEWDLTDLEWAIARGAI